MVTCSKQCLPGRCRSDTDPAVEGTRVLRRRSSLHLSSLVTLHQVNIFEGSVSKRLAVSPSWLGWLSEAQQPVLAESPLRVSPSLGRAFRNCCPSSAPRVGGAVSETSFSKFHVEVPGLLQISGDLL